MIPTIPQLTHFLDMHIKENLWLVVSASIIMSVVLYFVTLRCIKQAMSVLRDRGIYGIDINKITPEGMNRFREERKNLPLGRFSNEFKKLLIPESLGIVAGAVYLAGVILLMLLCRVPLTKYNAAICCIALMLLLGFVDDVLDVRWRHKIILSIISTAPLMLSYDGSTTMLLPKPVVDFVGTSSVDLGFLYVIAMSLVCVFCTNSINILAGVNGLEVGQSIVIGLSIMAHNVMQFFGANWQPNLVSFVLTCPFVAVCFGLLKFNKYPSAVFVGDSFTYFSGITLAVVAITGHFTKTLMLFFIPQLLNFVISLPQLFGIVECPRHRVPRWDPKSDKMFPSYANERCINLTLLNVALVICGPLREGTLTKVLVGFQVFCTVVAFVVRYHLAGYVYDLVE
eukprot:TRINITY_DN11107_c0_g1_i1.p1 TRINITY_DN11107_c0_g1~~TRINITY_DN11107_c0_g1_i1.p1  ORF type:complete len:424 (+),score=56.22 TRINITY_DN11107_c0_g1_i1:83-1273(+)